MGVRLRGSEKAASVGRASVGRASGVRQSLKSEIALTDNNGCKVGAVRVNDLLLGSAGR